MRKVYPNAKLWNYKVSDYDPENQSSKSEENKTKELENKVDRLQKTLDLLRKTPDHDKQMNLQQPKPLEFGKYEMT